MQVLQRLRIVFGKGAELKYISHLDLLRVWERALRRARVPLTYSEGFNPRPKLFFAAALAVGCTGRSEMLDLLLERRVELHEFASALKEQMPDGLQLHDVSEVELTLPTLSSDVIAAEYEVRILAPDDSGGPQSARSGAIQARVDSLLAATSIPRQRERPDGARAYDLRPLIQGLQLTGMHGNMVTLGMRLQADAHGTGRPDEVMAALGMADRTLSIERTQLVFRTPEVGQCVR